MNCLVVGATGYIGAAIIATLEAEGHHVVRVGGPFSVRASAGFSYSEGLYAAIQQDLGAIDAVVYAAGRVVPSTSISINEALRLDALPLGELLETLSRLGTQPAFVLISSAGAIYGPTTAGHPLHEEFPPAPVSTYGLVRSIMEQMLEHAHRTRKVRGAVLRLSNVYGPNQRLNGPAAFVARALDAAATRNPMELWGSGEQQKDFLFIDDLTGAVAKALDYTRPERPSDGARIFNICRGESESLLEVLSAIKAVTGKDVPYRAIDAKASDVQRVELSADLASRVLGWRAVIDLPTGLARCWALRR